MFVTRTSNAYRLPRNQDYDADVFFSFALLFYNCPCHHHVWRKVACQVLDDALHWKKQPLGSWKWQQLSVGTLWKTAAWLEEDTLYGSINHIWAGWNDSFWLTDEFGSMMFGGNNFVRLRCVAKGEADEVGDGETVSVACVTSHDGDCYSSKNLRT